MGRVVFLAIGSRGDVAPMVALARELADRGIETLLLTQPEYTDLARLHDLPCVSLRAGLEESRADQRRAQKWIGNPVLASLALQLWQRRVAATMAPVLLEQVRTDDVVITGVVGVAAALALAEDRGCRPVHVTFSATLPTAGPMAIVSPRTKRPSRLVRWWTRHGVWASSINLGRPLERAVRRSLRLRWRSPRTVAAGALRMPVLVAASPTLLPQQPDWPSCTVVTGAWELPRPVSEPDSRLREWLDRHSAPVYVGFGSMLSTDAAADLRLIDHAARAAGVAVVFQPDDHAPPLSSTDAVAVVAGVDHRWLFPRCSAVIHHGGAGTTNTALGSGVPSAIIAHGFDQPFHGRRLQELGVGPAPLARRTLTVGRLAALFLDLSRGPSRSGYVEAAASVGDRVRSEDGVGTAADWVETQGRLHDE